MFRAAVPIVAAVLLQACSLGGPSKPASFYTLTPQAGTPVAAPARAIAVGPIDLPEIYDRPQIVTRLDDNRLELAEYDRWAGSLVEDMQRVLIQDLVGRLDSDTVFAAPWEREDAPQLQASVRVFRFDGVPGGQVHLVGTWQLLDAAQGCRLAIRRFDIAVDTGGDGYARYVDALSQGLAQLSQSIAALAADSTPGCPP